MMKVQVLALLVPAFQLFAQQAPPVRQLGPVVAATKPEFGTNVWVRHLRNGSVLVNDIQNRRVVMLDSTLAQAAVIADSTPATANAYSGRAASLIAYRGDSTLFVDPQSLTMLVIDPNGTVGRTMALPRSQDAMMLGNSMIGGAAFDGQRLVYRAMPAFRMMGPRPGGGGGGRDALPVMPEIPDSTPILRVDLATRAVDTVAHIRIPRIKMDVQRDENGRVTMSSIMNPLPTVDDWAVLSDGSIALVRGRDYHVDFIRPDGAREASAKIPFDWRRLTDEDKVAFMDSVKAQRERLLAQQEARDSAHGNAERGTADRGAVRGVERGVARGAAGGGPPGAPGEMRIQIGGGGGGPGAMMGGRNMQFVSPDELPDYQPVFFAGAARADADGNLWIRTTPTKALPGGAVYDVVNARGELVDRVQVPADRMIAGFGPGGVVYLVSQTGTARLIERARSR